MKGKKTKTVFQILEQGARDKSQAVKAVIDGIEYSLEPLVTDAKDDFKDPVGSGGLLLALFQWRQLLVYGEKGASLKRLPATRRLSRSHLPPPSARQARDTP